jgi:metallophosphoesterase superfamily enzyme
LDITFVSTKQKYSNAVTLGDLKDMITLLEEQRQRTVASIRDMLKDKFSG